LLHFFIRINELNAQEVQLTDCSLLVLRATRLDELLKSEVFIKSRGKIFYARAKIVNGILESTI
jgi:hypothetical protein